MEYFVQSCSSRLYHIAHTVFTLTMLSFTGVHWYTDVLIWHSGVTFCLGLDSCTFRGYKYFAKWNDRLKHYIKHFDAVTLHDYTAHTLSVDSGGPNKHHGHSYTAAQRRSVLASWGEVQTNKHAAWTSHYFGDNVEIWMTEWSYVICIYYPS